MSMSVGSESGEEQPMMEINTTPLIDVMLVLLIVLIISIPPMTQAVNLDLPTGKSAPPLIPPEVITLEVDFDGTYLWNGTTVPDMATLESYFRQESVKQPQPELHRGRREVELPRQFSWEHQSFSAGQSCPALHAPRTPGPQEASLRPACSRREHRYEKLHRKRIVG